MENDTSKTRGQEVDTLVGIASEDGMQETVNTCIKHCRVEYIFVVAVLIKIALRHCRN
jgi:hypothetical protein